MHQIIRSFRRQKRRIRRELAQFFVAELRLSNCARRDGGHVPDLVVGGEKRFFVFLQVTLIARRETL